MALDAPLLNLQHYTYQDKNGATQEKELHFGEMKSFRLPSTTVCVYACVRILVCVCVCVWSTS